LVPIPPLFSGVPMNDNNENIRIYLQSLCYALRVEPIELKELYHMPGPFDTELKKMIYENDAN